MPAMISPAQREAWKAALRDTNAKQARGTYCVTDRNGATPPTKVMEHCCLALYADKVLGLTPVQLDDRTYPKPPDLKMLGLEIDGAIPISSVSEFVRLNDVTLLSFPEIAERLDEILDRHLAVVSTTASV